LKDVFNRLRDAGLQLGPNKRFVARDKCIFLGHEISKAGIGSLDRINIIRQYMYLSPRSQKELHRAMGLFNWFRKFITHFNDIAYPLRLLIKKQ